MTQTIIISGGGLVGSVTALLLANQGLNSVILDKTSLETFKNCPNDGRTTAVSLASKKLFESIGLWGRLSPYAAPIYHIKVCEPTSPWGLYFNHTDLNTDDPMGYILDNHRIKYALWEQLSLKKDLIEWKTDSFVLNHQLKDASLDLTLNSGETHSCPLFIVAEGRDSTTCQRLGVSYKRFSYDQKALVFSVTHEKPHGGVAWELFNKEGPLAFLPLQDCPDSARFRSGVVWTLPTHLADQWYGHPDEDIAHKLHELFPYYGPVDLYTQKWIYPLKAQIAEKTLYSRTVIIGDSAQCYHPVAGQGVNVGWKDALLLTETIRQAQKLGFDKGSNQFLEAYEKKRRFERYAMLGMTHAMVKLFSNKSSVLSVFRNSGLGAVNAIPPLKRFFMKRAMGI